MTTVTASHIRKGDVIGGKKVVNAGPAGFRARFVIVFSDGEERLYDSCQFVDVTRSQA